MDARLHHLQGKAEGVKTPDLIRLLEDAYRDRLALVTRHEAGARQVSEYDVNNTYQYIINREEQHLHWLCGALCDVGATTPDPAGVPAAVPEAGRGRQRWEAIATDDARLLADFVARWRDRVATVTNARIRTMLQVIVGEAQEHQRLFEDVAGGNLDTLGRRTGGARVPGAAVMASRWTGD